MVVCLALPGSPVDLCWLASPSGSPATSYKLPNAGFAAAATTTIFTRTKRRAGVEVLP
jgi:hypothetical protein